MANQSRGVDYYTPANPDAPYFAIKIEDAIYDIDINYIESITITRATDQCGDFSFTIVNVNDPGPKGLEYKFCSLINSSDKENINIQYGWNKGPKSPWYSGQIMDYTPTFLPGGYVKLDVTGKLVARGEKMAEQTLSYTATSGSDLAAQIAVDMGWVIEEIEPSQPFSKPQQFSISNVDAYSYMRELETKTFNSKKEPYKFVLDSQNGVDHFYFVSVNKTVGTQKNYNFFVNMGNYGSVLSWSPSYKGRTVAARVMESPMFDSDTNDINVFSAGSKVRKQLEKGPTLTVYGSTDPDYMEALLANKWYHENIGYIDASLEIVGDPTITPLTKINVIPMDSTGNPHISAGTYFIKEIVDTISGDFRSSLTLTQMGIDGPNGLERMPFEENVDLKGAE